MFNSQSPWRERAQQPQTQDSPSSVKIKVLSDKWSTIQNVIEKDKFEKREILETQINRIEQAIGSERPKDELRFKTLKDHYVKLQDQMYTDRLEREVVLIIYNINKKFDDIKQKEIKYFEEQLMFQLDEEKNHKRKLELVLLKQIEDRFHQLGDSLQANNKQYQDKTNSRIHDISYQVSQLRYTVDNESQQREDSQRALIDTIDGQVTKFQENMLIERSVREETQKKIFSMIEDIHQRIQVEIQTEKREREITTDALLKLLEDACSKIDENFRK